MHQRQCHNNRLQSTKSISSYCKVRIVLCRLFAVYMKAFHFRLIKLPIILILVDFRYCNSNPPTGRIQSSWESLQVELQTDIEISAQGFSAIYYSRQYTLPINFPPFQKSQGTKNLFLYHCMN